MPTATRGHPDKRRPQQRPRPSRTRSRPLWATLRNCGRGSIRSPGRPSMPPVLTPQPSARPCRMWPSDSLGSPPPAAFVWRDKSLYMDKKSRLTCEGRQGGRRGGTGYEVSKRVLVLPWGTVCHPQRSHKDRLAQRLNPTPGPQYSTLGW